MSNTSVRGVLPVFQTPYLEDESIDFATLEREIDWLFESGADGIVMAMVSEVLRLSEGERLAVAEFACKATRGRGTVIISVGAESSVIAEAYTRHAESVGASAVMAIPPVSVGLGDEELTKYYERILGATARPVIVQDASGYVGRPMSIELQAKLREKHGERVLFKPEASPIGPRLSALRDATNRQAKIFEGTGGLALVDSHARGIVGTMPGADTIKTIVPLWKALERGDHETAEKLSMPLVALISLQTTLDAFLAVEKHLLVKQGVFKNEIIRGPVGWRMDRETRERVDGLFGMMQGNGGKN